MTKKVVDGIERDLTAEEESALTAANNAYATGSTDRAMATLRFLRTEKLRETDYYALSDVTMSSDMTTYRQALRDLPSNYTTSDSGALKPDLSNLNWPTKP